MSALGAYLISKLYGAALIGWRRLKEGGVYFKFRGIIHMKFQNLVIFFFRKTINNHHYEIKSYIPELAVIISPYTF